MRQKKWDYKMANSDWEIVDNKPENEWQVQNNLPHEGLLESILRSPFRMLGDIGQGVYSGIRQLPAMYEQSKTELPGLMNVMKEHPLHAMGQFGAGITEAGHNMLNIPHGIAEYMSNRLNLIPESAANKVPYQQDIEPQINEAFGEPKYPGESLIRGAARDIPNIIGATKLSSFLNPLNLTHKSIANDILNTKLKNEASYENHYTNLWKEAENKGLGGELIEKPAIDFKTIEKYTPANKRAYLEDFKNENTLNNAHFAKSELLKTKRDLENETTFTGAQQKQYNAITDAVSKIQNNMFKTKNGMIDKDLYDRYRLIQNGYKKEVVPYQQEVLLKYAKGNATPKKVVNTLSNDDEFSAKRGMYHNLGTKMLLRKILGGGAAAGAIYEAGKYGLNPTAHSD